MNTSPIILILGAGPNIGQHVARAFAAKGYKVALVSRQPRERDNTADLINISGDLSDPNSVIQAFSKVKALLGLPSVVVYNGGNRIQYLIDRCANILEAAAATANDANNPLSLPLADITRDLSINTTSAFVAAQQAVLSFAELPDSVSETFMYTGNILNTTTIAPLMSLGIGKSGTAHLIQSAAAAYADRGFKFYYGDERNADGSPSYFNIDGEAHGDFYVQLAEHKSQGPWQQTFVKGVGYKNFTSNL